MLPQDYLDNTVIENMFCTGCYCFRPGYHYVSYLTISLVIQLVDTEIIGCISIVRH